VTDVPATGLSAGEVARRLGIAATTVRSWDRRYGLGPSVRAPGRHRRYSQSDVARLELMRRLTIDGVTAAEAARVARDLRPPSQAVLGLYSFCRGRADLPGPGLRPPGAQLRPGRHDWR
jgi:MerR family transcriptional regulator, light-induced transcriptional regulator